MSIANYFDIPANGAPSLIPAFNNTDYTDGTDYAEVYPIQSV